MAPHLKFGHFCRLCLKQSEDLVYIKALDDDDSITYIEKLRFINESLVTDSDIFPHWLCPNCKKQLCFAYKFLRKCLKSNTALIECINQIQSQHFGEPDKKFYITNIKTISKSSDDPLNIEEEEIIKVENDIIDMNELSIKTELDDDKNCEFGNSEDSSAQQLGDIPEFPIKTEICDEFENAEPDLDLKIFERNVICSNDGMQLINAEKGEVPAKKIKYIPNLFRNKTKNTNNGQNNKLLLVKVPKASIIENPKKANTSPKIIKNCSPGEQNKSDYNNEYIPAQGIKIHKIGNSVNENSRSILKVQAPEIKNIPFSHKKEVLETENSDNNLEMLLGKATPFAKKRKILKVSKIPTSAEPQYSSPTTGNFVFSCKICFQNYKSKSALQKHSKTHESNFPCAVCGIDFKQKSLLKRHLKDHTKQGSERDDEEGGWSDQEAIEPEIVQSAENLQENKTLQNTDGSFECNICTMNFVTNRLLVKHMREHFI